MSGLATISRDGLYKLVKALFEPPVPQIYEAYSAFGEATRRFTSAEALIQDVDACTAAGEWLLDYALYYPDTKGYVQDRRFELNPKKCSGKTFRYTIEGWGVIHLQCDFRKRPSTECWIAVNSEKRARAHSIIYPELRSPDAWDWKRVEKHARRIIRKAKQLAREVPSHK